YYRLSVIRIHVPPLRERLEEIPHLSAFFLRDACERLAKPDVQLGSDALEAFSQYSWPGNVRQLKNEIQRAVAMSMPGGTVEAEHLSPEVGTTRRGPVSAASHATSHMGRTARTAANLADAIEEVEREVIQAALNSSSGNISQA